ncbi:probable G-protein coupled receptor 75 [Haliotis rubra]|uniref:probable G-protein coupled receptor 75 n=1 Tax=Haliotis rubra TaxID=36100 RepID=UPI001EE5604E|nr:probable G-protein coupled receptor 75 [Haliotis rubra]XP_046582435.1 probable G-protein coupled receptor 75 [Haliotis rubra]
MAVSRVYNCTRPAMELAVFQGSVHTASLAVCTVLVLFVLILGSVGNGVVILSAIKCRKLRSNFDLLIVNLAGTDFILCTCLSPVFLYLLFTDPPTPRLFCGSFLFLGTACGMLSLLTIVAIAIHRQARVVGHAKGTLTPTQTAVILGTVWFISLSTALGGTMHVTSNWSDSFHNCQVIINSANMKTHNFILFFISPVALLGFAIIIVSYLIIARAVRTQSQVRTLKTPGTQTTIYRPPKPKSQDKKPLDKRPLALVPKDKGKRLYPGRYCQCCSNQAILDKENKAVTMCLVVILTIVLCWSPLVVSQFVELITGESIILYQVKLCGIALVFLNSALDPYIYAQHNGRIKHKYGRMIWEALRCDCKGPKRNILTVQGTGKREKLKHKSQSHVDQDTHTLNLASPKQTKKFMEKRAFHANNVLPKTYTSNILLYHNAPTTRLDKPTIPCDNAGGASVKKTNQVGDLQAVVYEVKSFVHKSCCHTGSPKDHSWVES